MGEGASGCSCYYGATLGSLLGKLGRLVGKCYRRVRMNPAQPSEVYISPCPDPWLGESMKAKRKPWPCRTSSLTDDPDPSTALRYINAASYFRLLGLHRIRLSAVTRLLPVHISLGVTLYPQPALVLRYIQGDIRGWCPHPIHPRDPSKRWP